MSLDTASLSSQNTATPEAKQQSKLILRSALQKANEAVQCDSTNDVMGAITAYNEAISLLDCVLATVEKENDRRRLQEIHDSYSERIRLLSTIAFKIESETPEEDPASWLSKPTKPEYNSNTRPYSKPQSSNNASSKNLKNLTISSSPTTATTINTTIYSPTATSPTIITPTKDMGSTKVAIESNGNSSNTIRSRWQDNISPPSSIRSVSLATNVQKEITSLSPTSASSPLALALASPPPTSPIPLPPLQASKSTPIKSPIQKKSLDHSIYFQEEEEDEEEDSLDDDDNSFDLEKDELNILGQHESHRIATETTPRPSQQQQQQQQQQRLPPPRFSSRPLPPPPPPPHTVVDLVYQPLGTNITAISTINTTEKEKEKENKRCSSRASVCSLASNASSIESSNSEIEVINHHNQPAMTLPSLRTRGASLAAAASGGVAGTGGAGGAVGGGGIEKQSETPVPVIKNIFRARTSSLPRVPLMRRSSSMTTVETIGSIGSTAVSNPSLDEEYNAMRRNITQAFSDTATTNTTSTNTHYDFDDDDAVSTMTTATSASHPHPHQHNIPNNVTTIRPPVPRPSTGGGLGSMRKKAANRLSRSSMDGNGSIRKDKSSAVFGLFIKEPTSSQKHEISSMDYIHQTRQPSMDDSRLRVVENSGHLKLLFALEKSMNEGGYITQKLYIPKNLWFQPNIRLNSMDIKITACESLMSYIGRLESWTYLNDLVSSLRLIENFELAVGNLETNLLKKLKRESSGTTTAPSGMTAGSTAASVDCSIRDSTIPSLSKLETNGSKKTQSFMSWGTKITKSVERMNAFSLIKTEDQFKHYIEALQRLFVKIHVLEYWLNHYVQEQKKTDQELYELIIVKLEKVCDIINKVIGGFIVTDITVLLAKWLKRGSSWVNE